MRKICIILMLVVYALRAASGQTVTLATFENNANCTDFSVKYPSSTGYYHCPFTNSTCDMDGWQQSHGAPQLSNTYGYGNNTYVAYLSSRTNGTGDGIFKSYSFEAGRKYTITYQILTGFEGVDNFYIKLANGLTANTNCYDSNFPSTSGISTQTIHQKINFRNLDAVGNGGWSTFTFVFTPNANYSQIWLYPRTNSTTALTTCCQVVNIDNITLCPATTTPVYTSTFFDPYIGRIKASISSVPGASSYRWYLNGNLVLSGTSTRVDIPTTRNDCDSYYDLAVTAVNSCGESNQAARFFSAPPCSAAALSVYPNPASEEVTVEFVAPEKQKEKTIRTFEVKVYDKYMQEKLSHKFAKRAKGVLSVKHLPPGVYILQANIDGETITKTLQISR